MVVNQSAPSTHRASSSPQTETASPPNHASSWPPAPARPTTALLSLPVSFSPPETLCKGSQTTFALWGPAYFTEHAVLGVHPRSRICRISFLLGAESRPLADSPVSGHLGASFRACGRSCYELGRTASLCAPSSPFGRAPRSGIAGSPADSKFSFVETRPYRILFFLSQ